MARYLDPFYCGSGKIPQNSHKPSLRKINKKQITDELLQERREKDLTYHCTQHDYPTVLFGVELLYFHSNSNFCDYVNTGGSGLQNPWGYFTDTGTP